MSDEPFAIPVPIADPAP